jgi:predicted RNase H-like HicB family nuclease
MMKYLIVIEKSGAGYSAYSPDLPDCVSTGATPEETEAKMKEAVELHIEGLKEEGLSVPEPSSLSSDVEVAA